MRSWHRFSFMSSSDCQAPPSIEPSTPRTPCSATEKVCSSTSARHQRGWTMGGMAGALGVVLEKRGHYRLGEAGAAPTSHDIARSVRIALAACGAAILLFLLIGRVI